LEAQALSGGVIDEGVEGRGRCGAARGTINTPRRGSPVTNDNASDQDSLEDGTRKANSNLQRLIEAIGGVLAASGDLLMRVQGILGGGQPVAGGTNGQDECSTSPPVDGGEG
jgi:hypothetical protein